MCGDKHNGASLPRPTSRATVTSGGELGSAESRPVTGPGVWTAKRSAARDCDCPATGAPHAGAPNESTDQCLPMSGPIWACLLLSLSGERLGAVISTPTWRPSRAGVWESLVHSHPARGGAAAVAGHRGALFSLLKDVESFHACTSTECVMLSSAVKRTATSTGPGVKPRTRSEALLANPGTSSVLDAHLHWHDGARQGSRGALWLITCIAADVRAMVLWP